HTVVGYDELQGDGIAESGYRLIVKRLNKYLAFVDFVIGLSRTEEAHRRVAQQKHLLNLRYIGNVAWYTRHIPSRNLLLDIADTSMHICGVSVSHLVKNLRVALQIEFKAVRSVRDKTHSPFVGCVYPIFTEQLSIEKKRTCVATVDEKHRILSLVFIAKFRVGNEPDVKVDYRRCGMPVKCYKAKALVYLLVDVDKLYGICRLLGGPFDRAAQKEIFGDFLIATQVIPESFRLTRPYPTAEVQYILPPQGIKRKRFHFLDLVQVCCHLFRLHGCNPSGRYCGEVGGAGHVVCKVCVRSGKSCRGNQAPEVGVTTGLSVIVVPDVDVLADDEKVFWSVAGGEVSHKPPYGH